MFAKKTFYRLTKVNVFTELVPFLFLEISLIAFPFISPQIHFTKIHFTAWSLQAFEGKKRHWNTEANEINVIYRTYAHTLDAQVPNRLFEDIVMVHTIFLPRLQACLIWVKNTEEGPGEPRPFPPPLLLRESLGIVAIGTNVFSSLNGHKYH